MPIQFSCTCGKELRTADEHIGRKVRCPVCGALLTVPPLPTSQRSPAAKPDENPLPLSEDARQDLEDGERPDGNEEREPRESRRPKRRKRRPRRSEGTSGKAILAFILGLGSFCGSILFGLPAVLFGFWSIGDVNESGGRLGGKGLAVAGIVLGLLGSICSITTGGWLIFGALPKVRQAALRAKSQQNLREIGGALHSYEATYRSFPAAASFAPDGKPLLSWRVAILPFLNEDILYLQFHLDEPWDSPNNRPLLSRMPLVYSAISAGPNSRLDQTHYRVFHSKDPSQAGSEYAPVFDGKLGISMAQITRGAANTILVVEAAEAVPWTKPDELPFPVTGAVEPLLGGEFGDGYQVLFADGSVRYYRKGDLDDKTLKAAISRNSLDAPTVPQ